MGPANLLIAALWEYDAFKVQLRTPLTRGAGSHTTAIRNTILTRIVRERKATMVVEKSADDEIVTAGGSESLIGVISINLVEEKRKKDAPTGGGWLPGVKNYDVPKSGTPKIPFRPIRKQRGRRTDDYRVVEVSGSGLDSGRDAGRSAGDLSLLRAKRIRPCDHSVLSGVGVSASFECRAGRRRIAIDNCAGFCGGCK